MDETVVLPDESSRPGSTLAPGIEVISRRRSSSFVFILGDDAAKLRAGGDQKLTKTADAIETSTAKKNIGKLSSFFRKERTACEEVLLSKKDFSLVREKKLFFNEREEILPSTTAIVSDLRFQMSMVPPMRSRSTLRSEWIHVTLLCALNVLVKLTCRLYVCASTCAIYMCVCECVRVRACVR